MNLLCRFRHRWVETSRVTWKDDGASTGSAVDKCTRCGERRRRFLEPTRG